MVTTFRKTLQELDLETEFTEWEIFQYTSYRDLKEATKNIEKLFAAYKS